MKPARAFHLIEDGLLFVALSGAIALPLIDAVARPFGSFHVPGGAEYLQQLTLWLAFMGGLVTTRERKHLTLSTAEFLGQGTFSRLARVITSALADQPTRAGSSPPKQHGKRGLCGMRSPRPGIRARARARCPIPGCASGSRTCP